MFTLKQINIFILFVIAVFISGCSTTTKIKYLEPAQVVGISKLKRISVDDFKRDTVGLTGKIETKISQTNFNNKPYFTLVNRTNIKDIIAEQKRQYSGITNDNNSVQLGELIGAQAFITGNIHSKSYNDSSYYEQRQKCLDKNCKQVRTYNVSCKKRNIYLAASIKVIKVESSKVIYTNTFSEKGSWSRCSDSYTTLPNPGEVWNKQANSIANKFIRVITPSYSYKSIELLDDPDINYTDTQQDLLKNGLSFVEKNRIKKADSILSELVFSTQSKSFVANYNLGVVKEAQGDYTKAKQLFTLAENLLKKPNSVVSTALKRINYVIVKHKKAQQQLSDE